ncbi:MAG: hypothetical protein WHS43_04055 [Aquificaceae bacterium]|uniref:arsenic resistance protein n=1 Tax=Hydrogenobacter sp. Uz 6-8 TaxID=3384828 RepID=UPI0030A3B814
MFVSGSFQSLCVFLAIFVGIYLGRFETIRWLSEHLITPFLFLMLLGIFLNIPIGEISRAYRGGRFFLLSLAVNFLATPAVAYLLGLFFLREEPALWIGFLMLLVTPCTDWYLVFTAMAGGNLPLSLSILPVNFLLQVALLPVYLELFFAEEGSVDMWSILRGIVIVILIPLLLTQILRRTGLAGKLSLLEKGQTLFLALAITAMFASQGEAIKANPLLFLKMLPPLFFFFLFAFLSGMLLGRLFLKSYRDTASLTFTLMARNSPIALAIALTAFEDEPLVALALVIGPLIELPVLFITARGLLFLRRLGL